MSKNNIVEGLDIVNKSREYCENCKLNKCTKVNHPPKTSPKANKPGVVLHFDTAGPSNVISHGKSRYFVLCKGEATRYRQVAFVPTKDLIPDKIKEFISRATLETNNQVLQIETDRGTEFLGPLKGFLEQRGIIAGKSTAGVPQQNGFIEREIRTIKDAAKTMLNTAKLNKNLWAEAINCAVYVMNRVVNSGNSKQTPYEPWHGYKPDVGNLRIFGELAIVHSIS